MGWKRWQDMSDEERAEDTARRDRELAERQAEIARYEAELRARLTPEQLAEKEANDQRCADWDARQM